MYRDLGTDPCGPTGRSIRRSAAGYINIMSASGSGGGAEAGTSGYCWSASSAGKNGYALTYSVSAIKTEAEPSKTWACPVRCVKDVK